MIFYGRQNLDQSDKQAVIKVLDSSWLTQGPTVERFETGLAKKVAARYAVVVSSGTAALHLAYLVAGLGFGDEVITTPNTFVATTNMLLAVGAKPVFCDIRLDTYNIDESKIEQLITPRTRAIVPVHFAGHPCEMKIINKIAKKYNLGVIEDACHALGAIYQKQPIGSLSDLTIFSFHPVKAITTGEGGAIVTNNKIYYERLKLLRSHGVIKDQRGFNAMTMLGYNYRLTDIQAALGISQLRKLPSFIKKRHQVIDWYERELSRVNEIILPTEQPGNYAGWHLYVIRVKNPRQRLSLMSWLREHNIGVNFHYPAVYSHPYYQQTGYDKIKLPNAEIYHESALTLPLHTKLTKKEVDYIVRMIGRFFNSPTKV
ncbi:MAG: UDP-4-amino-4,6-dideoxy-N-acetyl-beta-L-altrosamine transaminase [Patescibacteria group bacterium]